MTEDEKMKTPSAQEEEEEKLFVGYVAVQTVDSDGIPRRTIGNRGSCDLICVKDAETNQRTLTAELSTDDPLWFIALKNPDDFLSIRWTCGKWGDKLDRNNLIAEATIKCKDIEAGGGGLFPTTATMVFVKDRFKRRVPVSIYTEERRLVQKVARIELEVSPELYDEWFAYYKALKKWDKDEDKKKDGEKEDEKEKE
eukprot:GHVH01001210.1.p1 GENE.GHVH01001210.1~~GHVH01001210.1.p1  ORF type:complete len:197 (+),score=45.01 GHVH01001210.1:88-678(+)